MVFEMQTLSGGDAHHRLLGNNNVCAAGGRQAY